MGKTCSSLNIHREVIMYVDGSEGPPQGPPQCAQNHFHQDKLSAYFPYLEQCGTRISRYSRRSLWPLSLSRDAVAQSFFMGQLRLTHRVPDGIDMDSEVFCTLPYKGVRIFLYMPTECLFIQFAMPQRMGGQVQGNLVCSNRSHTRGRL